MFYSHTFLARKGPLGTVWCAAHLQDKLKKSHYISTNVSCTVDRIMFPEVPIALRMSGHLLLGVVRIYSKQVDYLYEDCNEIRITINRVFTTVNVNLPNDASHAPIHTITLPEKFNLDTMELDDYYKEWSEDSHLKSKDDITLTEQFPTGKDPFIVISFDEHDLRPSPSAEDNSGLGPMPMDEDAHPPAGIDTAAPDFEYPSPSNQREADNRNVGTSSPQDLPSIEIMRDARHGFDFNNSPILPNRADPDKFLEEQINKDKEMSTPVDHHHEEQHSSHHHEEQHWSHHHEEHHLFGNLDSPMPFVHQSPEMEIQPSPPAGVHQSPEMEIQPPPPVAQPRVRRRRKFDELPVLTNGFMKNALNDTSDIRRAKRNCPLSSLAIWKQNNRVRLRKEGLFIEPFITGTSADLQGIYKEDSAKRHQVTTEETHQETYVAQPPLSGRDSDVEIETLRNNECVSPDRIMPEPSTFVPSPNEGGCFTPENPNLGLQSEHLEMTDDNEMLPTTDVGASGHLDSEIRTPETFYANDMQAEHTALSDIPELVASVGELGFLEQDDNSPAGFQGTPESGIFPKNQGTPEMSSRTRAVAQYLQRQSATPVSGNSNEPPEELSLNKILEGKTRKVCARMFYETLVLKSLRLVDARQEDPYGAITLKVTPKLSKGKFPI